MDDTREPDENQQPATQPPVIPAPVRPVAARPAAEPVEVAEPVEPDGSATGMPVPVVPAAEPVEVTEPVAIEDAAGTASALSEEGGASIDQMVADLRTDAAGQPEASAGEPAPEAVAAQGPEIQEGQETAEPAETVVGDGVMEGDEQVESAVAAEPDGSVAGMPVAEPGAIEVVAEDTRALRRRSAKIPFWVYLGVWVVFAGVQTYLMWPLALEPFTGQPVYGLLVLIATGLVCSGPILGLCVWWFVSAHSERDERSGLVRAVLVRSAAAMAGGVVIWWIALMLLDLRRLGMLG